MQENENRFNYFEKIFLRISLGLLVSGILLFILVLGLSDFLSDFSEPLSGFAAILLFASIASFLIATFRILKFVFVVNKRQDGSRITKSVISFFTSPFAIIFYYLLIFILAISSCEIQ